MVTSLGVLVEDFLASCAARGLSRSTVEKNYGYALRCVFLPWCQAQGLEEPGELTQRVLDAYAGQLLVRPGRRGQPLARWTVHGYVQPVRHLLRWARRQGLDVTGAEPQRVSIAKLEKHPPTRREIQAMEDACQFERDRILIRLMGDLGIRNGELRRLRVGDLVERDRRWFLVVNGKGLGGFGRPRTVPLPRLYRRLKRFSESTRPSEAASDRLFVSVRRPYRPISEVQLENVVHNAARAAGIGRRMYPHLLRAAAITWLLQSGLNTFQVSAIVGNFANLDSYWVPQAEDSYDSLASIMAAG